MWQQKILDKWNQSENTQTTHKPLVKFLINHNQVFFVATETPETITIISINFEIFTISKNSIYIDNYSGKFKAYYIYPDRGQMKFYTVIKDPENTKNKNEKFVIKMIKKFRKY